MLCNYFNFVYSLLLFLLFFYYHYSKVWFIIRLDLFIKRGVINMRPTRDKPEVRTAQLIQAIISRAFERLDKGDTVSLQRLEEVLRFLMLMMEKAGSPPLDIDSTVRTVMSECQDKHVRLRLVSIPQKKRLVLGDKEPELRTGKAV